MVLCGFYTAEAIAIHPDDDLHETHFIYLEQSKENPTFSVSCCCDEDWEYTFVYSKSDYERIKFTIINAISECDSMEEIMDALSEIFEEYWADILVDTECDGDCENCEFDCENEE